MSTLPLKIPGDIDIDLPTKFDPLTYFPTAIRASMLHNDNFVKHNVGVYFQPIPVDHVTGLAAILYEPAEDLGYVKIDFLHIQLLDYFESKAEIQYLIKKEPNWNLLLDEDIIPRLFHLGKHAKLLDQVKPKSIQEIADCIALIRPGKRNLVPAYVKNRKMVRPLLYQKPTDGMMWFKKSHSICYALNVVLQLHLIEAGVYS